MAATNTIHPPKNAGKRYMTTWTSGDGNIQKQLDYILVSDNIKNWINYSKTKGTTNINSTNQREILCMENMVKFKKQPTAETLKHINFDIDQLRENTHLLTIDQEDNGNKKLLRDANELITKTTSRGANNQIWDIVREIMTLNKKCVPTKE